MTHEPHAVELVLRLRHSRQSPWVSVVKRCSTTLLPVSTTSRNPHVPEGVSVCLMRQRPGVRMSDSWPPVALA